jgi:hypothetical protein
MPWFFGIPGIEPAKLVVGLQLVRLKKFSEIQNKERVARVKPAIILSRRLWKVVSRMSVPSVI